MTWQKGNEWNELAGSRAGGVNCPMWFSLDLCLKHLSLAIIMQCFFFPTMKQNGSFAVLWLWSYVCVCVPWKGNSSLLLLLRVCKHTLVTKDDTWLSPQMIFVTDWRVCCQHIVFCLCPLSVSVCCYWLLWCRVQCEKMPSGAAYQAESFELSTT